MPKAKSEFQDLLGLVAFVSAAGNLLQADDRMKLKALYENLATRYRDVCNQVQTLARLNEQLRQENQDLRKLNDSLQKQSVSGKDSK